MTKTELMDTLTASRDVVDFFETLHDASLKNMVTVYTGDTDSMIKVANFIKTIVTGFSAPAIFSTDNLRKIETFITDDSANMSMALIYAMQIFKHDRVDMLQCISVMIENAWDLNYDGAAPSSKDIALHIGNFPAILIIFMCMLFPNTSIGMLGQLMAPPARPVTE